MSVCFFEFYFVVRVFIIVMVSPSDVCDLYLLFHHKHGARCEDCKTVLVSIYFYIVPEEIKMVKTLSQDRYNLSRLLSTVHLGRSWRTRAKRTAQRDLFAVDDPLKAEEETRTQQRIRGVQNVRFWSCRTMYCTSSSSFSAQRVFAQFPKFADVSVFWHQKILCGCGMKGSAQFCG